MAKIEYVMLEISVPKDVHKSPEAMEIIFNTLHEGGGVGTNYHKKYLGNQLNVFSLEIASIEGAIYFFIRTPTKFAELLKNQIYSQYPQAEVHEVDDYTRYIGNFTKKQDEWGMWGVEFGLAGHDALPIKTYIDYGLDKAIGSLEEYQKIDPITSTLEFLGSLRKDEQVWIQYMVRHDKQSKWRKDAEKEIGKLMGRLDSDGKKQDAEVSTLQLTSGEQQKIKAIEKSLGKIAFEVGFRALYLARGDAFRASNIAGLIGSTRQYNSPNLNGFKPVYDTGFKYPWQDYFKKRGTEKKRIFFENFVNRAFYYQDVQYDPYSRYSKRKKTPFVLTSEELATIFRIPGRVSETTTLERIESTKSQPPQNLPI